jgi:hypothetical protein
VPEDDGADEVLVAAHGLACLGRRR